MIKDIEEMKKVIAVNCGECYTCKYQENINCVDFLAAEALYNAGYRKESDTAREIFTELLKDENVHINVRLDQWGETYNVACVDFDTIEELAKERYGVEVE